MDLRMLWEALSIGRVSLLLDNEEIVVTSFFFAVAILIQFLGGLFTNYQEGEGYYRNKPDTKKIWKSMYCLFYIPILLLAASFEVIFLIQFSFHETTFFLLLIGMLIYKIISFFYCVDEERLMSVLGVMRFAQYLGLEITKHKKIFFEDFVRRIQAVHHIKSLQNKHK